MLPTLQRDLRLLGTGVAGNAFGASGEQVVTGLLVYSLTGSSAWVGVALAIYYVPNLLVGALTGALADRADRRRLLVTVELSIAIVMTGYAWLLTSGDPAIWLVLVLAFVSGCARAMHHTLRISYACFTRWGPPDSTGISVAPRVPS